MATPPNAPAREERVAAERNWRRISDLTEDDRFVIRERHFGWEKAAPALLADIFRVPVQTIVAVLRREG